MPPGSILLLDNVSFTRNHNAILDGVSWEIRAGEHWALLGANGSGKTTLLKIVTGYEWATSGAVEVLGERFGHTNVRELRKRIGWVSTSLEQRLPSEDKALDIVASGVDASLGTYRRFSESEKADAFLALSSVGGESLARKRFGVLSQGEQQRVIIARALVAKPALLILDEPCAGLDPAARARFLRDLSRLASAADAPSLILVTHHIEEIGEWINRVHILSCGRVIASGVPADLITSETLTKAFGMPCSVERAKKIFRLEIEAE